MLYQIVSVEAMLFCILLAGYSVTRVFYPGERPKHRWIAGVAAGIIGGVFMEWPAPPSIDRVASREPAKNGKGADDEHCDD
ncbi:hypothetical protein CNY89_29180, partial [Amaricoccus sp. HAR-UPW-R2A-40]